MIADVAGDVIAAVAEYGAEQWMAGYAPMPFHGPVSRRGVRKLVALVRSKLGEEAPVRVNGLRTNWAGRALMSRYGV